jgi:hypothetical protein
MNKKSKLNRLIKPRRTGVRGSLKRNAVSIGVADHGMLFRNRIICAHNPFPFGNPHSPMTVNAFFKRSHDRLSEGILAEKASIVNAFLEFHIRMKNSPRLSDAENFVFYHINSDLSEFRPLSALRCA